MQQDGRVPIGEPSWPSTFIRTLRVEYFNGIAYTISNRKYSVH